MAATWTCASSNTGVATTSDTATGCAATGVAAGGVTITAAITKGGETSNAASSLDVIAEMTGEPAVILIGSITDGDTGTSDDDGVLSGQVSVTVNVERGDQTLELLSVLVDGEVADYQLFGGASMAPPGGRGRRAGDTCLHPFVRFGRLR